MTAPRQPSGHPADGGPETRKCGHTAACPQKNGVTPTELSTWAREHGWSLAPTQYSSCWLYWQRDDREGHGYNEGEHLDSIWREERDGPACEKCGRRGLEMSYMDEREKKLWPLRCFSCRVWSDVQRTASDPKAVVVDGERYWIEKEHPPDARFGMSLNGFGGAKFVIRFKDGREVTTRNLWRQGAIPPQFREAMPDNAEFVKS